MRGTKLSTELGQGGPPVSRRDVPPKEVSRARHPRGPISMLHMECGDDLSHRHYTRTGNGRWGGRRGT